MYGQMMGPNSITDDRGVCPRREEATKTKAGCPKCGSPESFNGGYCVDCSPRVTLGGEFKQIPDEAWDQVEDGDDSCLSLSVRFWGLGLLHLAAFRVHPNKRGRQVPDTPQEWVKERYRCYLCGETKPWRELAMRGAKYVIFACPGVRG